MGTDYPTEITQIQGCILCCESERLCLKIQHMFWEW